MTGPPISNLSCIRVVMFEAGFSYTEIARLTKCTRQRVCQIVQRVTGVPDRRGAKPMPWWERVDRQERIRYARELAPYVGAKRAAIAIGYVSAHSHGYGLGRIDVQFKAAPKYTYVLQMWNNGARHKDIMQLLNVSESYVSVTLNRARKRGLDVRRVYKTRDKTLK